MKNTIVRGGGGWSGWVKNKNKELGEKLKKGKEKMRKITLKKALKMHLLVL